MKSLRNLNFKKNRNNTMEALVSGHPRGVKKESKTGAGRFRESKNTEFVWEMRKTGFRDSGRKESWGRLLEAWLTLTVG